MASVACATFDFRANEDFGTKDQIIQWLSGIAKHYVFQKEQGDGGYIHWQGRMSLIKKRRKSELMTLLKQTERKIPNYLEPTTSEAHRSGDMFYAVKEDTRVEGPFSDKDEKIYIPRQVREMITLYPWQQQVIDDRDVWNKRTINLVYSPYGNQGKSSLVNWCRAYKLARCLPPVNDFKDLMRMVCDMPTSKMYLFDMPRAMYKDKLHGFYSGIEMLKEGYAFDDRYTFREISIDSPNIWVFTNQLPDEDLLSRDRWVIWTIDEERSLKKYVSPIFKEVKENPK